jgi:streptogramin lyase
MTAKSSSTNMVKTGLALAGITCMLLGLATRPALADRALPPGGHIAATIPDPASPAGFEAGFGSIWAANSPAGTIIRIDPTSNKVVATIQAGRPVCCLAFGDGAVWAASFATDSVVRIDPATNSVADAFPSGGLAPEGIAFGDGYVWVANHHGNPTGSVTKIDPATDTVIDVIPVGAASFTGGPSLLASVPGSVWAGVPNQSAVVRIDTAIDAISATIPVHGACGEVAAGSQQVWISGGTPPGCLPGVSQVDPATNSLVTHLTAGGASSGNSLGAGGFWFGADTSDLLNRVDTATNSIIGQLKLPGSPGSIATGFGSVWVADQTNSAISRVAPD